LSGTNRIKDRGHAEATAALRVELRLALAEIRAAKSEATALRAEVAARQQTIRRRLPEIRAGSRSAWRIYSRQETPPPLKTGEMLTLFVEDDAMGWIALRDLTQKDVATSRRPPSA
jgi:hypothetical protein